MYLALIKIVAQLRNQETSKSHINLEILLDDWYFKSQTRTNNLAYFIYHVYLYIQIDLSKVNIVGTFQASISWTALI